MVQRLLFLSWLLASVVCGAEPLNNRVLVVYARNSRDSEAIAKYYAGVRHIPAANLCGINLRDTEATLLSGEEYEKEVKKPVADCLTRAGKQKILYIVLAYIRPYRVNPGGRHNYALDSYLADIWDYYTSQVFDPIPTAVHPYYAPNRARDNFYPAFVSLADLRAPLGSPVIYSVWRLDGPTPAIARSLVDKAIKTEAAHGPVGQACIDEIEDPQPSPDQGYRAGDWDLFRAAQFLSAAGFHVLEDNHGTEFGTPPSTNCLNNTALYAGWYSLNHYNDAFA